MKLTAKEVILVLSAIHTDIIEKAEKRDECYMRQFGIDAEAGYWKSRYKGYDDDIKALYSAISKISGVEVTS